MLGYSLLFVVVDFLDFARGEAAGIIYTEIVYTHVGGG